MCQGQRDGRPEFLLQVGAGKPRASVGGPTTMHDQEFLGQISCVAPPAYSFIPQTCQAPTTLSGATEMPQSTNSALRTLLPSGFKSLLSVTPLFWQRGEMPMGLHFAIRGPEFKTLTLLIPRWGIAANHFPSVSASVPSYATGSERHPGLTRGVTEINQSTGPGPDFVLQILVILSSSTGRGRGRVRGSDSWFPNCIRWF